LINAVTHTHTHNFNSCSQGITTDTMNTTLMYINDTVADMCKPFFSYSIVI